jgi:hypothetical protein
MPNSANGRRVQIEELRGLVDPNGVLRDGALDPPPREEAFTVFAQRTDARMELAQWQRHAEQFFDTRLGLSDDKRYPDGFPSVDAAIVIVATKTGQDGARLCFGRARTRDDLAAAEDADARGGSAGLGLLAKRCGVVWLVTAFDQEDKVALRIAAIIASVVLGPILSPDQQDLFGLRTARRKLEEAEGPAR